MPRDVPRHSFHSCEPEAELSRDSGDKAPAVTVGRIEVVVVRPCERPVVAAFAHTGDLGGRVPGHPEDRVAWRIGSIVVGHCRTNRRDDWAQERSQDIVVPSPPPLPRLAGPGRHETEAGDHDDQALVQTPGPVRVARDLCQSPICVVPPQQSVVTRRPAVCVFRLHRQPRQPRRQRATS